MPTVSYAMGTGTLDLLGPLTMYVSRRYRRAFLAHPRTASRSVRDALKAYGNLDFRDVGDHHSGPPQFHADRCEYFCVIRNHWDAVASWFFNANTAPKSGPPITEEWCATYFRSHQNYFRPGTLWWFTQEVPSVRILRFENLENDLRAYLKQAGVPDELQPKLPHVGKSRHRDGRKPIELFTEHARKYVEWIFGDEIRRFGYRFKP